MCQPITGLPNNPEVKRRSGKLAAYSCLTCFAVSRGLTAEQMLARSVRVAAYRSSVSRGVRNNTHSSERLWACVSHALTPARCDLL